METDKDPKIDRIEKKAADIAKKLAGLREVPKETVEEKAAIVKAAFQKAGRTFANPVTADDTEADLPTLEELAEMYHRHKEMKDEARKTKKEILEKGTVTEKARLYFGSKNLSQYLGATERLTVAETEQIRASITSPEDRELWAKCSREYLTLINYAMRLQYFFKVFQTSFSLLAVLLNRWEEYELMATYLTSLYKTYQKAQNPSTALALALSLEKFRKETIKAFDIEDAALYFDEATGAFAVNVNKRGGLYSQIKEEAKEAAEDLANFKAYAVVAEEFIAESSLQYMPVQIDLCIDNAMEERYTRFLVPNLRYFRSELNERKERGETITPEDERRAVIPDYLEVKPTPVIYRDCKQGIKRL